CAAYSRAYNAFARGYYFDYW
nr:immunoglobulin heavy chain junction region [Macaca mulatta]